MPPDSRHQGRRRSHLLRALDNEEDGASSAFLTCWVVAESEAQKVNKMGFFNKFISHL